MNLNKKAELDFLVYANAVIKSRAISSVEDNLKPVHRRILYTLQTLGLDHTHKTTKCANVVGNTMTLHPHGDSSIYDALIRLAQPWKMRYPLIEVQGNAGNILGYSAAAARYTECRLSAIGDFMLEDINKECIAFKPNYDNSKEEPITLPGMFPNILCNGNSGIAVGLSSSLVPHNYNEVADAIIYALSNNGNIGNFIKGPDFPTGGTITNGEVIPEIYRTGHGTITLQSKYRIETSGGHIHLVFTEIPYLVTIEDGIIEPIKKLVTEEGYDMFDNIINNTNEKQVEIRVVLNKGVDPQAALAVLWAKTNLQVSIKINNTVIDEGMPKVLSLEQMVTSYIYYRHWVIRNIAKHDYEISGHKLTVILGLEKCMTNIDKLISLIRNSDNNDQSRAAIMAYFELSVEQANAILDMKISRLNKLDIIDLAEKRKDLENAVAKQTDIMENIDTRRKIITDQLNMMRKYAGDPRRTVIGSAPVIEKKKKEDTSTQKWYSIKSDKISLMGENDAEALHFIKTNSIDNIVLYNKTGDLMISSKAQGSFVGGMLIQNKPYVLTITKNGYLKKTAVGEYNYTRISKALKLREDDELILVSYVDDNDFILALTGDSVVKISTTEIDATTKLTMGVKMSANFTKVLVLNDSQFVVMVDVENHGKITSVRDFNVNNRGSEGQKIAANTLFMIDATDRDDFVIIAKSGKDSKLSKDKFAVKSRTAVGAQITAKTILNII